MRSTPEHSRSITASHYNLDSHAVRKREPGRVHLDGFFSYHTDPYCVPYGVIVPKKIDGLLIPVPVSGTHVGFSTLRMEPCWMALGQAAGIAAALAVENGVAPRGVSILSLQKELLEEGAVLMYFRDIGPGDDYFTPVQYLGLRGFLGDSWEAKVNDPVTEATAEKWIDAVGGGFSGRYEAGVTTRGELLAMLYEYLKDLSDSAVDKVFIEQ